VRFSVQHDGRAHRGRSAKAAAPKTVAENCHRRTTRPIFLRQKSAALRHGYSENRKYVRCNLEIGDILGLAWRAESASVDRPSCEYKRAAQPLAIEKIVIGDVLCAIKAAQRRVPVRTLPMHRDQSARIVIGQLPQKYAIDHAEHYGGRADAKRQRQQCHDREAWLLAHGPKNVAAILPQIVEPTRAADIATFLLHLLGAAELQARDASRFVRSVALAHQIG